MRGAVGGGRCGGRHPRRDRRLPVPRPPRRGSRTTPGTPAGRPPPWPRPPGCSAAPTSPPRPTRSFPATSTRSPRPSSPPSTTSWRPISATTPDRSCSSSSCPSAPNAARPGSAGYGRKSWPATARTTNSSTTRRNAAGSSTCPPGAETTAGVWEYQLTTDNEGRAVLEAAIGPLSAPHPDPTTGERDPRPVGRRRGDALIEALRRAVTAAQHVPTSPKAVLMLTMDYTDLADRVNGGTVVGTRAAGTLLAPDTIRKIACDAAVIPVILGADGEILDQGRDHRLFTTGQIRALWLRDTHCTFDDCDAPATWCDAHHITHWIDGGATDLHNAALLCPHHHTIAHRDQLARNTDPPRGLVGPTTQLLPPHPPIDRHASDPPRMARAAIPAPASHQSTARARSAAQRPPARRTPAGKHSTARPATRPPRPSSDHPICQPDLHTRPAAKPGYPSPVIGPGRAACPPGARHTLSEALPVASPPHRRATLQSTISRGRQGRVRNGGAGTPSDDRIQSPS